MLPGNDGERSRCDRAEKLRDHDDMFAAVFVRQMSGGQRKANDRNGEHQTNQTERGGGMCAPVNFPLTRSGQQITDRDEEKMTQNIEIEVDKAKGSTELLRHQSYARNSPPL